MPIDKGSLLITNDGLEIIHIPEKEREKAIIEFYDMKQMAERHHDRFYALSSIYSHSFSYGNFYPNFYNMSWKEFHACESTKVIGETTFQLMQSFCQYPNVTELEDEATFQTKTQPRTFTGYGNPTTQSDLVSNKETWEEWHRKWYSTHPKEIEWESESNTMFPRPSLIISILKRELSIKIRELENERNSSSEYKKINEILSGNNNIEIVNAFHKYVMRHKGNELVSYAHRIGEEICISNYYTYEKRLSGLESQSAKSMREIYSIENKERQKQYISIDFKHGMFEFHNANGEHLGEYRFDGSFNSKAESDHSFKCINQLHKGNDK